MPMLEIVDHLADDLFRWFGKQAYLTIAGQCLLLPQISGGELGQFRIGWQTSGSALPCAVSSRPCKGPESTCRCAAAVR